MSERYIFFSLRNFKTDTGETVRIYGMLNALASAGKDVTFISNATDLRMFHPKVRHVCIGSDFSQKRKIQGMLAVLPVNTVVRAFRTLFHRIQDALKRADVGCQPVFFFDYLDNSIGYILKKKGWISRYINDIHGIATLEFQSHIENSRSIIERLSNLFKYSLIEKLDKKVFESADGFIFGSEAMKKYYQRRYNIKNTKSNIIPYVLGDEAKERRVDDSLKKQLQKELNIGPDEFVVLFVGGYKPTSGVDDLIEAFDLFYNDHPDAKLILIGSGPLKSLCLRLAESKRSRNKILFIEQIPYSQLLTYQSLGNVVVCPDKNNKFSQYVIHIKYFDALLSGRLVINGAFESVKEVNPEESLSLTFEPSNFHDLYLKLKKCHDEYSSLMIKYQHAKDYTIQNLTYSSYLDRLDLLVSA